jgi:hypothetical protein
VRTLHQKGRLSAEHFHFKKKDTHFERRGLLALFAMAETNNQRDPSWSQCSITMDADWMVDIDSNHAMVIGMLRQMGMDPGMIATVKEQTCAFNEKFTAINKGTHLSGAFPTHIDFSMVPELNLWRPTVKYSVVCEKSLVAEVEVVAKNLYEMDGEQMIQCIKCDELEVVNLQVDYDQDDAQVSAKVLGVKGWSKEVNEVTLFATKTTEPEVGDCDYLGTSFEP